MKQLVFLLALLPVGCSDAIVPVPQRTALTEELRFLEFKPHAFENAERTASFWAVKGREGKVELEYGDTGEDFLEFEVDARSLAYFPDGTPMVSGDSVRITVTADSAGRFAFRFEPSGLRFSSEWPARLTLNYGRTNPDIDEDGSLTSLDAILEVNAGIWSQDVPVVPWVSVPTYKNDSIARADVYHFTEFGMAVN